MKLRRIIVSERKLRRTGAVGLECPGTRHIAIDPRQRPRAYLNTLIHECLHKVAPEWSESRVKREACAITRVLWETGYRRIA